MYPYRTVERALAYLHGDTGASALRVFNRLKHLVRLGLTPETPGKGRHISYTFEDAARWAYALQVLEYGMDPTDMFSVVHQTWDAVWRAMGKDNHGQNELMVATPNAISHPHGWGKFDFSIKQFQTYRPDWTKTERIMVINVSMISRNLRSALAEVEAGTLRDLSAEIEQVKSGETDLAHIKSALQNRSRGAAVSVGRVNGGPLVSERGPDGVWRELLPIPKRPRGRPRKTATMVDAPGVLPPSIGDRALLDDAASGLPLAEAESAPSASHRPRALDLGDSAPKRLRSAKAKAPR